MPATVGVGRAILAWMCAFAVVIDRSAMLAICLNYLFFHPCIAF
jgi:hypothetical protein